MAPADFPTDFDALKEWCEKSYKEVRSANEANPIRGKELGKEKLQQLRSALLGKSFRWRIRVHGISPSGSVGLQAYHFARRELYIDGSRRHVDDIYLSVRFRKAEWFGGDDWTANPYYRLDGVNKETLRNLTNGEYAVVVGKVTDVSTVGNDTYTIDVREATIE